MKKCEVARSTPSILPKINELSTEASKIKTAECLQYFQQIASVPKNQLEAERLLQHILAVIEKETTSDDTESSQLNQVLLNLAFRAYFQLLRHHELPEEHLVRWIALPISHQHEGRFKVLYAILLTVDGKRLDADAQTLCDRCLQALLPAIKANCISTLTILKVINLLCKKFPMLVMDLPLEYVYHCLQNEGAGQSGVRDEMLILFKHCCKRPDCAFAYFQLIVEFWPWSNRNKLYLLSCTLNDHNLLQFLAWAERDEMDFFNGLRLSLSYKSLLAASQYLVKTLSNQESHSLLELAADILTLGFRQELQNFYSQWFGRISQKDKLFELVQQKPEIARFLTQSFTTDMNCDEHYRLILIFSMFSRQIFNLSKLQFFKLSTELVTNCFMFDIESQLLIFKLIVNNFGSFAVEDGLEFIVGFVERHKNVECAHVRNSILGQVPAIVNYVAKMFARLPATDNSTMEASIENFFRQLQTIIITDIGSALYQPKIFALKLQQLLIKSLYAEELQRNAKNCTLVHNQRLGAFLLAAGVFDAAKMSNALLNLFNDPLGFDDAFELMTSLLQQLKQPNALQSFQLCIINCQSCDIDECGLGARYAKVAMQSITDIQPKTEDGLDLFEFCLNALTVALPLFQSDPFLMCKSKNHLFGYLNVMNEVVLSQSSSYSDRFPDLIILLERIMNIVLDLLNLTNLRSKTICAAASFEDMDNSLEILLQESSLAADSHEDSRKFLLISFWLTLKACCDLATTIGCNLVPATENSAIALAALEKCLNINIAVLTRCRHKGAIEAGGVSIGRLTKCITTSLQVNDKGYALLHSCLELLFDESKQVSTTRRGAGFSIMFLHIVKNEVQCSRPLLKRAVNTILQNLRKASGPSTISDHNCDRMEALTLHFLCVLVRDTELRAAMSKYHHEIILTAILQIDNADWTICNAALQLFGAILPKIVGQKQSTELVEPMAWEHSEVSFSEISYKLPKTCAYILEYCETKNELNSSTRAIILFLGFLAKVEHLQMGYNETDDADCELLPAFRALMWRLLRHRYEKVRSLAARCFVRLHEFRYHLPDVLLALPPLLFAVKDENLFQGLVCTLGEGVLKLQHESQHTVPMKILTEFLDKLKTRLSDSFRVPKFKFYTLCKLLDLLLMLGYDSQTLEVMSLVKLQSNETNNIGHDEWLQKVTLISD